MLPIVLWLIMMMMMMACEQSKADAAAASNHRPSAASSSTRGRGSPHRGGTIRRPDSSGQRSASSSRTGYDRPFSELLLTVQLQMLVFLPSVVWHFYGRPPYVIGQAIIFLPRGFYLLLSLCLFFLA